MSERFDLYGQITAKRIVRLLDPNDRPLDREIGFTYDPASGGWSSYQPLGAARRSVKARWHRRLLRVRGRDLGGAPLEHETFVMNGLTQISHWADLLPGADFAAIDNEGYLR
jgi:hypothetical protein